MEVVMPYVRLVLVPPHPSSSQPHSLDTVRADKVGS